MYTNKIFAPAVKVKGVDGIAKSGGGLRRVRTDCKIEKKSVQRGKKTDKKILVETKVKEEKDEERER